MGWQPTSGKGGKPSSDWTNGPPPTGQTAYVKSCNGTVAQVCIDSATSPLGDAGIDLSNALAGQQALISQLVQTNNSLLAQMQMQSVQLANLANTVSMTMERLSNAQSVALPGEVAKGIATGITELGKIIAPFLIKTKESSNGR